MAGTELNQEALNRSAARTERQLPHDGTERELGLAQRIGS